MFPRRLARGAPLWSGMIASIVVVCMGLMGCSSFSGATPSPAKSVEQQLGLTQGTPGPGTFPVGWRRLLDGQSFTDSSAENGFVVSPARPDRLAGCALPVLPAGGRPTLLLSSDGGRSWQSHAIPIQSNHWQTCLILADALQANTFIIEVGRPIEEAGTLEQLELTQDAGKTWRQIVPPAGYQPEIYTHGETTLVGGTFYIALSPPSSGGISAFARLTPDGKWQNLDAHLPVLNYVGGQPYLPMSVTVDPTDAHHLLIAMYAAQGIEVYESSDAGASWQATLSFPHALVVSLWSGPGHRFYAQDVVNNTPTVNQFFFSADSGQTWVGSGLHDRGADFIFISPKGRVVTAADNLFFTLDPTTGVFAALGPTPTFGGEVFTCVIVEGGSPTLVCAGQYDTFARSLPAFHT